MTNGESRREHASRVSTVPDKNGRDPFSPNFTPPVNKTLLRDAMVAALREELARQAAAAALAHDEATHEESRARSKYDTHSQEAAYLAQGQAKIAAEIEESLAAYTALPLPDLAATDAIALGALVRLDGAPRGTWYFLGPRAGGLEVRIAEREILVVTPQSPLGREFLGKRVGDLVRLPGRKTAATQRIAAVE